MKHILDLNNFNFGGQAGRQAVSEQLVLHGHRLSARVSVEPDLHCKVRMDDRN